MWQTIVNAFKIKEIRRKILITIAILFVYRLGCYIPVPGVEVFDGLGDYTFLQIMSAVSGGALQYGTFFAMGIGPYINASIIIQLLTVGIPALERLSKQGEEGKRRLNTYTRILTLVLAIVQAIGILVAFKGSINHTSLFGDSSDFIKFLNYVFLVVVYTAGAALTMWLGERITDYGVSNGISLLIFAGILATAGTTILNLLKGLFNAATAASSAWSLIGFVIAAIVIFGAIVYVDDAERKVPVQYAKQVKGRKMYGGQSTVIPIKVNANGVMPLIFAFSILSFPELIFTLCGWTAGSSWWSTWLGASSRYPFYAIALCLFIVFFAFFYSQIQFNPDDISKTIQQNGGFIPGIRPGKPTADYLKKINNRLTLFGAIFLAILALIPTIVLNLVIPSSSAVGGAFSATGMLIVVSVAIEFNTALESQLMMKAHKGFLK